MPEGLLHTLTADFIDQNHVAGAEVFPARALAALPVLLHESGNVRVGEKCSHPLSAFLEGFNYVGITIRRLPFSGGHFSASIQI